MKFIYKLDIHYSYDFGHRSLYVSYEREEDAVSELLARSKAFCLQMQVPSVSNSEWDVCEVQEPSYHYRYGHQMNDSRLWYEASISKEILLEEGEEIDMLAGDVVKCRNYPEIMGCLSIPHVKGCATITVENTLSIKTGVACSIPEDNGGMEPANKEETLAYERASKNMLIC